MVDSVLSMAFWSAIVIGLFASYWLEYVLLPSTLRIKQVSLAGLAVHAGLWIAVFGLALFIWQRPWFTAFNVLALQCLIIFVSNAKYRTLREPFLFQDFEYFTDAIRHPRLYLPFFGILPAIGAMATYVLVVVIGLNVEPALPDARMTVMFGLMLVAAGWALVSGGGRYLKQMCFDPVLDMQTVGLLPSLWAYAKAERASTDLLRSKATYKHVKAYADEVQIRPNLVVVQSESFFDARRYYPQLRQDILKNFDALSAASLSHGRLMVDAWGANTVRTEFSFLSGMAAGDVGVHRFNPYRVLAKQGIATMASFLKQQGYHTVCVHPYAASFYTRDRIMPMLGFDTFLDIRDFKDAERLGPYVSDSAVGKKVAELLKEKRSQPIFVYVITMENHGPLHWESVSAEDKASLLDVPLPEGADDLIVYARHLCHADQMFADLAQQLQEGDRPGGLCIFGDHVPIMSKVYALLGLPEGTTDYLLWSTEPADKFLRQDAEVADLSLMFLNQMGLLATGQQPAKNLPGDF